MYSHPGISPDGTKVVFTVDDGEKCDIWIWDVVNGNISRLTFNEDSSDPLWSVDGKRIAFMSSIGNENRVYWKSADGTGENEALGSGPGIITIPFDWSVDGKNLVTVDVHGGVNHDIGLLSLEGDPTHKTLLQEKYMEYQPKISPKGRWIAYTSRESGTDEIYVRPFPDVGQGRWQVSTNGGHSPLWSPDGKELFYRNDDEVIAVSVKTEPPFKHEKPRVLFRRNYIGIRTNDQHGWDIDPDGKRFLMMKSLETKGGELTTGLPRKINIVTNWFEELKEKVPVD